MEKGRVKFMTIIFGMVALLMVGWLVTWYFADQKAYQQMVASPQSVRKWRADDRPLQSEKKVGQLLAKLERQNNSVKVDHTQKNRSTATKANASLVVIPGLRGAWSVKKHTHTPAFGTEWVPQGVTQSNTYYYISAYDGDHKLDSVIYQVRKRDGRYVKTLILPSTAHVGGIYYDQKHKRLLYSDDRHAVGGLGYLSQRQIDRYHAEKVKRPIGAKHITMALMSRTSAITMYQNQLIVVKYGQNKHERSVVAVPLNQHHLPNALSKKQINQVFGNLKGKTVKALLQQLITKKVINAYNAGWDRLQGVAIAQGGVTILTQSNGHSPSKVWFQLAGGDDTWSKLQFTVPEGIQSARLPNSVEEVSLNQAENRLTFIFESGARKYREAGFFLHRPQIMDRMIVAPLEISRK